MFEKKKQRLVPISVFVRRMAAHFLVVIFLVLAALSMGVAGYHYFGGLSWIDALLNASMILGGMGPVDTLTHDSAKIFASIYALFSGLLFIGVMGILFAPVLHRMLHSFHISDEDLESSKNKKI